MKMFRKTGFLLVCAFALQGALFAQENAVGNTETEGVNSGQLRTPHETSNALLAPINSASLWTMGVDPTVTSVDFDQLDIAANPGEPVPSD